MRIGFVGAGNMGGAIIKGFAAAQGLDASRRYLDAVLVYDADTAKAEALTHMPGVSAAASLAQLCGLSDVIVLCVKPGVIGGVLEEIAEILKPIESPEPAGGKIFVSIAAGVSARFITDKLGTGTKVVRVMPNTPAMVGEGMSALAASGCLSDGEGAAVENLFSSVGIAVWVPEELMDIVTGISGSSPAYTYMYIEGLIKAGVAGGMSREAATIFAAQSTLGAAKMVLENMDAGVDPEQLRINVCSPGGTTIEAVKVLEEAGFAAIAEKAAGVAAAKSKTMAK
ncbi:MAG: pyrroline-5-carboxylate reductase [Clostridiales Family XIII bacterium]|jgi:pyrroline-5-carboxylate reductase|nr:pyrroline-5-carboxylate reductase [Clostridiales Family XIII bacterium]